MRSLYTLVFLFSATSVFCQTSEELGDSAGRKILAKDYKGAIVDSNKALLLDPENSAAYVNRGVAKAYLNDYRGAIADYNKCIQLNPLDTNVYRNRGEAMFSLKNYAGAIQDYSKAIEL